MGYIEVNSVSFTLPDGRVLLDEVTFRVVDRIITVELGGAGNTAWIHGGSFPGYQQARADRFARLDELRRRWDEEHAKLKALVLMYKPRDQNIRMRLRGRPQRQACRRLRECDTDGADAAVRPGGLVRRPGGRARLQWLG